jgi:hypothetical protein
LGIAALCLAVGFGLFFAVRTLQPIEGLGNHDVAGIAYEADLLLRGQLPYRDSIELKTPGSFFLIAAAWSVAGRSTTVLNAACVLWVLLGAIAVFVAAFATYGRKGASPGDAWDLNLGIRCGALASGLYLASSAQFESNYSTWMMPPYAAAYAALIVGLRCDRFSAHVWTGVFAAVAYLCKNHAFVIGAVAVLVWGWARARGEPGARLSAFAGWIVGALLGSLPISLFYAYHGAFLGLLQGVVPFEQATEYSQRVIEASWLTIVRRVMLHVYRLFPAEVLWAASAVMMAGLAAARKPIPFATIGAAATAGSRFAQPRARMTSIEPVLPSLAFVLLSVIAGGIGGLRFFSHYGAQYLPGLAILAAHPEPWRRLGVLGERLRSANSATLAAANLGATTSWFLAAVAGIGIAAGGVLGAQRHERLLAGEVSVTFRPGKVPQQAGEFIAKRSGPNDTIHCWGWKAWSVYFWADRRAPGRLYKELGAVTEYNDNGLFEVPRARQDTRLEWKPGPIADELLEVYRTQPPAFLVRARPFFPRVTNDPLDESGELARLIGRDYELVKRIDFLHIYEHRAHK